MKKLLLPIVIAGALGLSACSQQIDASSAIAVGTSGTSQGQVASLDKFFVENGGVITHPETYPTNETSHQIFKNQDVAGINKFLHKRDLAPTNNQPVVRLNRDTYYSFAVVDVAKGATVTMPELAEGKYVSVQAVTEDHRIQAMKYGSGTFDLTTHTGTHLFLVIRLDSTLSAADAQKYQDQMSISANSSNKFSAMPVNKKSFDDVELALKMQLSAIAKRDGIHAVRGMFTDPRDESAKLFTQEKYQVGAAAGWGGAQEVDNIYEPSANYPDDKCRQVTFADPKNKAFWSITVYNKVGFMFNDLASHNSNTAAANADGTYTVSFGCGKDAPNNIEIANDTGVFNLSVRHYMPSDKVRNEGYRILANLKAL